MKLQYKTSIFQDSGSKKSSKTKSNDALNLNGDDETISADKNQKENNSKNLAGYVKLCGKGFSNRYKFLFPLSIFRRNGTERSPTKTASKKVSAQCSSSTDEGCETDMGGTSDTKGNLVTYKMYQLIDSTITVFTDTSQSSIDLRNQRIKSYASSSSSSGVIGTYSKSLSQNLSRGSSKSNCSTFESIDFNLVTSIELAGSLPSCASNSTLAASVSAVSTGGGGSVNSEHSSERSFCNSNNSCVYMPPVTSTSSMLSTKSTPYTDKRSPIHFR